MLASGCPNPATGGCRKKASRKDPAWRVTRATASSAARSVSSRVRRRNFPTAGSLPRASAPSAARRSPGCSASLPEPRRPPPELRYSHRKGPEGPFRAQLACRPGSVPRRGWEVPAGGRPSISNRRCRRPLATYPGRWERVTPCPLLVLLQVGFAKPLRSPGALVRSYRTVSPLPDPAHQTSWPDRAVCFLWHCPPVTRPGRYPAPCPVEPGPSSTPNMPGPRSPGQLPLHSTAGLLPGGPAAGSTRRLEGRLGVTRACRTGETPSARVGGPGRRRRRCRRARRCPAPP